MPKRMLGSSFSSGVYLWGSLVLSFQLLPEIFEHQTHDAPPLFIRGALAKVNTAQTNRRLADPIVLLAPLLVGAFIKKGFPLGAEVTVRFLIVAKLIFAKRLFFLLVQGLALGGAPPP